MAEDAVAAEDVGTQSSQTSDVLVVRGLGDQIRLEEMNAAGRQFNDFRQIDRHKLFHLGLAHRSVLQDVDRESLLLSASTSPRANGWITPQNALDASSNGRTARPAKRLNAVTNLRQAQRREAGSGGRTQLHKNAGVNRVRTVSSCTDESAQRLAEAIRHFLRDVLNSVVNGGSQSQRGEVRVVSVLTDGRSRGQDATRSIELPTVPSVSAKSSQPRERT
jgi:hypothetical protein